MSEYKVIGKTCNCSGKPVNLILRMITKEELKKYVEKGNKLFSDQAVMVCPECGGTVINWLFLNQNVQTAKWAMKERYLFEIFE